MAAGTGRGLMAEILGGLALVMVAATATLGVMLAMHYEEQQRELLSRALVLELSSGATGRGIVADTSWWQVARDGGVTTRGGGGEPIDGESLELVEAARNAGAPVLRTTSPWGLVRFAVPVGREGAVAVARIPAAALPGGGAAPQAIAAAILLLDAALFIAFGASVLRGRVVLPLRRLAASARALADGAVDVRAPVEGVREAAEVAMAFNHMTDALAARTEELEKAVQDLRRANRDVRHAQSELARSERLAAVGRLAAGVAHEVGNPMGALLAFLDLAGRDPGLSVASKEHLARAGEQVERVRRILRRVLDFSRPVQHASVSFDLAAVAEETAALLRAQAERRGISVTVRREGRPPAALGDPAAASQILLNLGLNAVDALEGREHPHLTFEVRPAVLQVRAGDERDDAAARRRPDAVECVVSDNGPGVPPEDRERIFDPFFTTKATGTGTGLGLSNAVRLAQDLGGNLELVGEPPGACFVLRLPAADPAADCGVRTDVRSRS